MPTKSQSQEPQKQKKYEYAYEYGINSVHTLGKTLFPDSMFITFAY